jgi:predicted ATPase
MKLSLKIKDYKRISGELQIEDFAQINYFVGKNSSGKSTILNAISHLNDGGNSRRFFFKNSIVELSLEQKKKFLLWEDKEKNPNFTSHQGDLQLAIIISGEEHSEKGANGVIRFPFNYSNVGKDQLEFINETAAMIDLNPIKAQRIVNDDPWDASVGERIFIQDDKTVTLEYLAQGLKTFNNLNYNISQSLKQIKPEHLQHIDCIFIIIEEPENNLHPSLQKKVQSFLNQFIKNVSNEISNKLCFCISTHSPFVIGSVASSNNTKVYLMNDGSLVDLSMKKIQSSAGYEGHECAWVVGQMLGADVTDLGYPENYCVLEEHSLQIILEGAKQRGLIKNTQFISASGVSRVVNMSQTIEAIVNLNTLMKCNPYYTDKYCVIVDNTKELPEKEITRITKIREKLGSRFIELQHSSLEEYYENIDKELHENCRKELFSARSHEKGVIKSKYANLIAAQINSKEKFSQLFNHELDFLI